MSYNFTEGKYRAFLKTSILNPETSTGEYVYSDKIEFRSDYNPHYKKVSYIQSDKENGQYIDTGIYGNVYASIEIKVRYLEALPASNPPSLAQGTAFGVSNISKGYYRLFRIRRNGGNYGIQRQASWTSYGSGSVWGTNIEDTNWHKYYCSGGGSRLVYIDDAYAGMTWEPTSSSDYPITFYLFALNYYNYGATDFSSIQMEYCKIWDKDENLVRDYIPCLDPSGRPCMFDNVTGTAFYNQGNGEFTYGEVIEEIV